MTDRISRNKTPAKPYAKRNSPVKTTQDRKQSTQASGRNSSGPRSNERNSYAGRGTSSTRNAQAGHVTKSVDHESRKGLSERSKTRLSAAKQVEKPGRKKPIPEDKALKVIGHQLKPCVIISEFSLSEGAINEAVIQETKARLTDHELIKVKIRLLDREDRQAVIQALLEATGARLIHSIGKIVLICKASNSFSEKLSNIERHRSLV